MNLIMVRGYQNENLGIVDDAVLKEECRIYTLVETHGRYLRY